MSDPLVSVVVPVFNRSECVVSAVESIRAQTYRNWEAIVVDDGSTDGTVAAVEQLTRQDSRVRLVRHDRNRGAQTARNTGINAARGEWVAFLDSDDTWLPHSLEARLGCAQANNLAVVHSAGDVIEQDGVVKRYSIPPMEGRVYHALLLREGPLYQTLLVTREALRRIGGLDDQIVAFQEWDTMLSLAKYYEFGFVTESTFMYDCRRADTISKDYFRGGVGYEQVFHKRYWDILRVAGPGILAYHYRTAAKWYEGAGARGGRAVRRCNLMAAFWSALDPRAGVRRIRRLISA